MQTKLKLSLINTGFITEHLAYKYLNIKRHTLDRFVADNRLIKSNHLLFGKVTTIYELSNIEKNSYRNQGYIIYKRDNSQLEHDYLLNKVFLSISTKEQVSWCNETALKSKFPAKTVTSDAIFVKDNSLIAVEVLTQSYTRHNKNDKMKFISDFCDNSIILNVKDYL